MELSESSLAESQELSAFLATHAQTTTNFESLKQTLSTAMASKFICFFSHNKNRNFDIKAACKLLTCCFSILNEAKSNNPSEQEQVAQSISALLNNNIFLGGFSQKFFVEKLWALLSCIDFMLAHADRHNFEGEMLSILKRFGNTANENNMFSMLASDANELCRIFLQAHAYREQDGTLQIYHLCAHIIKKIISKLCEPGFERQAKAVIDIIEPFLQDFPKRICNDYLPRRLKNNLPIAMLFTIEHFLQLKTSGRISFFRLLGSPLFNIYNCIDVNNRTAKYLLEMFFDILILARNNEIGLPMQFVWQFINFSPVILVGWETHSFIKFMEKFRGIDWTDCLLIECFGDFAELCAQFKLVNFYKGGGSTAFKSVGRAFMFFEIADALLKNYMQAAAKQQILPHFEGPYWQKLEKVYWRLGKKSPTAYWNECQQNYISQSMRVESGVSESDIQEGLSGFINFPLEGESTQAGVLNGISNPELGVLTHTQRVPQYVVEQSMVMDVSQEVDLYPREELLCATDAQDLQQSEGPSCAEPMEIEPPTPITEQEKPLQSFEDLDYQSLTLEKLQQLSTNCRIFTEDFFFPMHQKYLQGSKTAAVPVGLRVKRKSAKEGFVFEMCPYQLQSLRDLVVPESSMVLGRLQQSHVTEAYTLYTSGPLNRELPAITVFAGRKELALLPHTQGACVFIVITEGEFSELRSHYPKLAALGYHLLVLKAPIGIHPETEKIEVMSSQESEAGKLTARRRAALLLGYDLGFETVLMFDDNIQSISYAQTSKEMDVVESWEFALRSLLEKHVQSGGIVTTVQTYNPKKLYASQEAHRIGWKLLIVDMLELRKILTREQSYFLFPCNLSASSEDAFLQIIIHIAAQSLGSPKKGFTRLAQQECYLVRSRNYRTLNSCVRSGVIAQEIVLAEHEARAAQAYLEPRLFEALRMTNFIFNNNLSLNRACQTMANERRVAVDIGTRVLKKRTIEGLAESCYAIPKEAATFQEALLAISDAGILNLRTPQENCLKAIAAERASPSELLVCTLPTGVGKTRIEAYVSYAMLHAYPTMHSIIVAPTRLLSGQIDNDFYIEGHNIVQDRDSLIPVYSGASSSIASSLDFLLQNTTIKSSMSGKIFIFCQKSFENLCEKAQATSVQHHPSALELLSRTKMIIFDEEHLTFSKDARSSLEQIQQVTPLPELSHMLGFTATSPKERRYSDLYSAADIAARRIIFSYAPKQAVIDGYIRPLIYKGAECSLESLADFMIRSRFTDKTPLLEHVGIMVCSSIAQLKTIAAVFKEQLTGTSVYSIYNNAPEYMESIEGFSQARSHALALVVNMLQEGYNQPQVRYTISLRKNIRASSKEQRAGRSRRKISQDDNFQALFISVKLLEQKDGQDEEYRFSGSKRPLAVVSEAQGLEESVTKKARAPVVLSSSSSGTPKRKTIYLG